MRRKNQTAVGYRWRPLGRCSVLPASAALVAETMSIYACDEAAARARLEAYQAQCEMYRNDLYQVQVRRDPEDPQNGLVHINIRRLDGAPCIRDWRHFQQIKNEILGPECEAVELYPAESRKQDTSNKYHLWGYANPSFRFPVGMGSRDVRFDLDDTGTPGMRQRPESLRAPEDRS